MFGLEKCSEEDFYQFICLNSEYYPEDTNGNLIGYLISILVFLGLEWCALKFANMKCPHLLSMIIKAFIICDITLSIFSTINNKKYAFKFQRFFLIIRAINLFVFSIIMYPMPLIILYYKNNSLLIKIIMYTVIAGFIYLMWVFIRIIFLIRKGEMRENCDGLHERLFGKKIAYMGLSIPIIGGAGSLGRRATIEMDNSGFSNGPLILLIALSFIIQILVSTGIPECIILVYCKSRFKSFVFPYKIYRSKNRRKKMKKSNYFKQ